MEETPATDLIAMLDRQVVSGPDATCLIFGEDQLTFGDFAKHCAHTAEALGSNGVQPGDRVVILAPAGPIFFELLFGCAKAGAIMVPVNARLSAREVGDIIADAEPALIIVADPLAGLLPETPQCSMLRAEDFDDWRDAAEPVLQHRDVVLEDPVLVLYTSGTTAKPKGVVLSHRNLSYLGRMAGELWSFTPESTNLAAMPLFHIGGIGWGLLGFSQGGRTVITRETEPEALLAVIARHDVTHAFLVPTVIQRLVDHIAATGMVAPQVDHMFYGGAPMGAPLLRAAMAAFGSQFHHTYGMTETAGTTVTLDPVDHDLDGPHTERLGSCGRAMPWVELKLVDPATGTKVKPGEIGEVRMRSPAITRGYWRNPEATAETITADGWLCSGDAATQDADGFITLRDRYKNMIVSGGENIYPAEIDAVLQHHPAVQDVAVVGIRHEKWGETPRAYVVLREGMKATEAEIIDFTREHLARYKCPTSVVFVPGLPRNASGKILKRELRK